MTDNNNTGLLNIFHKYCQYLPHIMLLVSVITFCMCGILGGLVLVVKASTILIPLIFISIFLIITKKNNILNEYVFTLLYRPKTTLSIFVISACILLVWIELGNGGWIQLLLLAAMYLIIILQLFSKQISPKIVLSEIIITTAMLALPQMLIPAYYQGGGGDIFDHAYFASAIIDSGTILPMEIAGPYTYFNLYHILIAVGSLITSFLPNVSLYIFTTLPFLFVIPIIYLLAEIFTGSKRVALFSAFFYSLIPIVLYYMILPTPRIMGTVAFTIILYLVFRNWSKYIISPIILVAVLTIYLTIVHHMQQPLFYIVIIFLCLGSYIYLRRPFAGNTGLLLIFLFISAGYLVFTYLNTIISQINIRFFGQIESESIIIPNLDITYNIDFFSVICNISSSIMIIFIFAGLFVLLTRVSHKNKLMILLPLILIFFVFFVVGPAEMFPTITQALQLQRFRLVLASLFALAIGFGCLVLFNMLCSHKSLKKVATIIMVILCLLLVVSSGFLSSSRDNEIFYQSDLLTPREYYIEDADVALLSTVNVIINNVATINTSHEWGGYGSSIELQKYGQPYIKFSLDMLSVFTEGNVSNENMQYLLFSHERYDRIGLSIWSKKSEYVENEYEFIIPSVETTNIFNSNMYKHNVVYENGWDRIYHY